MTDIVVQQSDPREHEAELKDLFARNGKPEFAAAFERAYRARAARGLRSWIGRADGQTIMHISVTPMPFTGMGKTLMGGILGDLMVAESHRDFWAPVRLLRTMIGDLKRASDIDFLVTTTVADAEPVFKAGGFKPFGTLRRYVMPLFLPYLAYARLKSKTLRVGKPHSIASQDQAAAAVLSSPGYWRPQTDGEFFQSRIPRYEFADANWLRLDGARATAVVSRHAELPESNLADAGWQDEHTNVARVILGAAGWSRRNRFRKFTATTLHESRFARQLERSGFFPREMRSSFLLNVLTRNEVPAVEDWFLTGFPLSTW